MSSTSTAVEPLLDPLAQAAAVAERGIGRRADDEPAGDRQPGGGQLAEVGALAAGVRHVGARECGEEADRVVRGRVGMGGGLDRSRGFHARQPSASPALPSVLNPEANCGPPTMPAPWRGESIVGGMPDESLNALDATFLELEEADQSESESAHMHIGAVMLFEPPRGGRRRGHVRDRPLGSPQSLRHLRSSARRPPDRARRHAQGQATVLPRAAGWPRPR